MSKRILIYYSSNVKTIAIQTKMYALVEKGYEIVLLTTAPEGDLHQLVREKGIKAYAQKLEKRNAFIYYLKQIIYLVKFCKSKQIDIVFAHLMHTSFIAVLAQFFMKTKVVAFRHHFKFSRGFPELGLKVNRGERTVDSIVNRLATNIVVPSSGVYNGMLKFENIKKEKLRIIPYIYNFDAYGKPNLDNVNNIKKKYGAKLRLLMCARLIPFKRHSLIFPIIKELVQQEYLDIKMLVLDKGPEAEKLQQYIVDNQLEDTIFMLGFRRDFLDYMAACELLIHPSLTEASNNVVKEFGLLKKPVLVCEGVGDFDDYIEEGVNSYLMEIVKPENKIKEVITNIYNNPLLIDELGEKLKKKVIVEFAESKAQVCDSYVLLINEILEER